MAGRVAIGLGAALLGAGGLFVNQSIHSAARSASTGVEFVEIGLPQLSMAYFDQSMARFPPLANGVRLLSFKLLQRSWPLLRSQDYLQARRMLAKAEAEGDAALAAEPENWKIHQGLASMYRAVAATDPSYQAAADRHLQRSLELAPNR